MLRLLAAAVMALAAAVAARADVITVYVYNFDFSINQPGQPVVDAVIRAGDTVRWVRIEGNHTTTAVAGSPEQWDAPISNSALTYERTFNNPGTYWYYCRPHGFDNGDGTAGGMAGTITVLEAGAGACCLPGGGCNLVTSSACSALGGTFQGTGTSCSPNPCSAQPVTVILPAMKDNVLYESATGTISNALGSYLFLGNQNSGLMRRSVIAFDTSSIPAGATVQSITLKLYCNQAQGTATTLRVHRLLGDWGEGTSQATGNESSGAAATAGDATWLHRFYPTQFWATPGGDFLETASGAYLSMPATATYLWSSPGLQADVQHWVNAPGSNFGWIIRGDEASSANTRRLSSRQSGTPDQRPTLTVTYLPPGPTGACCLPSGGCEQLSAVACDAAGGQFSGEGVSCDDAGCIIALTPFIDALPLPGVAQPVSGVPGGAAHYEIAMTEFFQQLHSELPPTRVWGYGGSYPGPTIEARRDQLVTVTWINDLRVFETGQLRTTHVLDVDTCLHGPDMTGEVPYAVVHLHGGHVPMDSDGYPEAAFPPGQQSPLYTYPNAQPAATIWYHDHALGITRLNVMMGLAGYYIIRDDLEDALNIPRGEFEIPLAIQDRSFDDDGRLEYHEGWHEEFFGDFILVNGKVWPYLNVKQGKYRFRMLNGSNSRTYTLSLPDGAAFWQIGTDLGLLAAPVALTELTIGPGERADVVMDFAPYAAGTELILTNSAPAPFPGHAGVGVIPNVMKFIVMGEPGHTDPLPQALVPVPIIPESAAVRQRDFNLRQMANECPDQHDGVWTINGLRWHDITEFPRLGSTEIWAWRNGSPDMHPMHMHLVAFQVLDRQEYDVLTGEPTGPRIPPPANEMGWKDTVRTYPGEITRVIARFETFVGLYPYHCHILEHEDHEMMRQFRTTCTADWNTDLVVNSTDISAFITDWLTSINEGRLFADVNDDGIVNSTDISAFITLWLAAVTGGGC